jgi:CubicO group peptidase (beta-lactamase class C family)
MPSDETLASVDAIFERFVAENGAPGIAYGVVVDGELVATGGHGVARLRAADPVGSVGAGEPPDADTPFRIASMTKSFTASTILMLRDEGRLRLDDDVATYVPELVDLARWSADAPPISIRHLLTMTAGLPSDDPWGDRQQDLPDDAFGAFLAGGISLVWPPGSRFEYSNLGFAILGRVIARVTGVAYDEAVRTRLFEPLGLDATFHGEGLPREERAVGYVRRADAWLEEPVAAYGAFAPMGGIWASIRDLARWVGGFTDAYPAGDDPDDQHPLRRSSRREMQQIHTVLPTELSWSSADASPTLESPGYGFGLFILDDTVLGRVIGHGGGYPGFGSNMRWHPASGIGVVWLANARYARLGRLNNEAMRLLLDDARPRIRRHAPWPETTAARAGVDRLLAGWDDELASRLFAMNVELDEPLAERRATFERLREVHGPLAADEQTPIESYSPANLAWWMAGERGRVRVEILLDPERPPLVQSLDISSVPDPPRELAAVAARIAELLGAPGPTWPSDIPLADSIDRQAVGRALRAAEALFGPVRLGQPIAGDGEKSASWRLSGDRGQLTLELAQESRNGPLAKVAFVPRTLEPPLEIG